MGAIKFVTNIGPLDANLYTGPTRMEGFTTARTGTVVLDEAYGEFATRLWVGVSGDITLVNWDGTLQLFTNVPVGFFDHCSVQVNTAGTSASELVWTS